MRSNIVEVVASKIYIFQVAEVETPVRNKGSIVNGSHLQKVVSNDDGRNSWIRADSAPIEGKVLGIDVASRKMHLFFPSGTRNVL